MATIRGFNEDDTLPPGTILYRRVSPKNINFDIRDADGLPELSSAAFQDYPMEAANALGLPGPCMSVAIDSILQVNGELPSKVLEGHSDYGLAQLVLSDVRGLTGSKGEDWRQGLMLNPTDGEPWHAVVFSVNTDKKTKGMRGELANRASWYMPPPAAL